MTKQMALDKLMECKKIFTQNIKVFFELHNPEYYTFISDNMEELEKDLSVDSDEEYYEFLIKRMDHFIKVVDNMVYFYDNGYFGKDSGKNKDFLKGIRTFSENKQNEARSRMNERALNLLDKYTDDLKDYISASIHSISIADGVVSTYRSFNYTTFDTFCNEWDAGVTITLRVKTSVRPKEPQHDKQ